MAYMNEVKRGMIQFPKRQSGVKSEGRIKKFGKWVGKGLVETVKDGFRD